MKYILLIAILNLIVSCAGYKYDIAERQENNTVKIKTNVPDAKISIASNSGYEESTSSTSSTKNNFFYETNYTFNKLKFGRTFLKVSKPNYEPQIIKIWRFPRKAAVKRSLLFSCFTYGVPIIIDVFRSDFYKIAFWSKEKEVYLHYTQDYMLFQYKQIENSTNPEVFKNYINEYLDSKVLYKAYIKKDSTELLEAVNKSSEEAIDMYITSHKNSKFIKDANDIKAEMTIAKKEFEKVKKINTVVSYEQFLSKYPRSLQRQEAHINLINAAEKQAITSNNLDKMLIYYENYLLKFKDFLDVQTFNSKNGLISKTIDNQIIKENNSNQVWNYEDYKKVWKKYIEISEKFKNKIEILENSENYRIKISNELISLLSKLEDANKQNDFLTKAKNDFEKLSTEKNEPFIITIFNNSNNKEGAYKFINQNIINYKFEKLSTKDPLINIKRFNYKGKEVQTLENLTIEEYLFINNKIKQIKLYNGKSILCETKYDDDFYTIDEISYFLNGKLARIDYFPGNKTTYFYEYENGINISFKELEEKIKSGDLALSQKRYDDAIDILSNNCINNYPSNIPLNQRIKNTLSRAIEQKNIYNQKIEQERLLYQQKQEQIRLAEERKRDYSINYNIISGIYQIRSENIPLNSDLNMYYILNPKGVVLLGMGSTTGIAFYDLANGIRNGNILTGSYKIKGNRITITMKNGQEKEWIYHSYNKSFTSESAQLLFIDSL